MTLLFAHAWYYHLDPQPRLSLLKLGIGIAMILFAVGLLIYRHFHRPRLDETKKD